MKAAVLHGPGDVRFEDIPVPSPGRGEVLIRTRAALTCGTDLKVVRRGYHAKMLTPPCPFGHEGAGEVAAVGEGVTAFKPGDLVAAANSAPCGTCRSCRRGRESLCENLLFWNGTFADAYLVPARVVEKNLVRLEGIAPDDAAMAEPLACCLKGVEDSGVNRGDRVLVIGAGSIALMLARLSALKGAEVTLAARRPEALHVAFDHGVDATALLTRGSDEALRLDGRSHGPFDVVFDAGGAAETAALAASVVERGGTVNLFAGCPAGTGIHLDATRIHYEEIRVMGSFHHTPAAYRAALALIRDGQVSPRLFVTATMSLQDLPGFLMKPPAGALKTLVRF